MAKRWSRGLGALLAVTLGVFMSSCGDDPVCPTGPADPATPTPPPVSEFLSVTLSWDIVAGTGVLAGAQTSPTYRFEAAARDGVPPYTFRWDFGDGSPEVEGNPVTHQFPGPGTYTVRVTVTDAAGSVVTSDPADGQVQVGCAGITVTCSAEPTEGESPLEVQFYSSAACGVEPVEYMWEFGDGTRTNNPWNNPSHTYEVEPGTTQEFVAEVTATDAENATATCSQTITVTNPGPPANRRPTVSCSAVPDDIVELQTSAISCLATDPDGDDLTWTAVLTNGGGGSLNPTAGGPIASGDWFDTVFTSSTATVATISATVEDPGGLTATDTVEVTVDVNSPPTVDCPPLCDELDLCGCSASDPDDNLAFWSVDAACDPDPHSGAFADPAGGPFMFTPWRTQESPGCTVTVTDQLGATGTDVVVVW